MLGVTTGHWMQPAEAATTVKVQNDNTVTTPRRR
jgi:hypothetical protein